MIRYLRDWWTKEKEVMVKVVIKWAQSHACMSYAEREQARRSQGGGELDKSA